ncbi:transcriptional regulator [Pseudobowmanella zhangzhouensis]|uniref:winged helix-turn-helix domain-containing protein n=1 Tax=Pseudobowmanella zhangzhouensis TaxID=1537679 RepID=UPI00361133E4
MWRIGRFEFCPARQKLWCDGETIALEPMAAELLAYFCTQPNRTVSKDELIDQVWQGRVVTDNAISRLVTKLRKALGDDPRQPEFIATLPKKGYSFIARAERIEESVTMRNRTRTRPSHTTET